MRLCSPNQFSLIRVGLIRFEFVQMIQFGSVLSWCGSMWFASIWFVSIWVECTWFDWIQFDPLRFDMVWFIRELILIPCCSNRADSIRCCSVSIGSIWFRLIQPSLVWSYFTRVCLGLSDMVCVGSMCFGLNSVHLLLYDLMLLDSIWWGVVRFDSMPCHVIQFDLWCFGLVWFGLGLIHVIWFHLVWLDLNQCTWLTRFDMFCSVSSRFNLIHGYLIVFGSIWVGLLRCGPIQVWCGLC